MLTRAIDPRSRQRPPTRMAPIHHAADKADVDALTTLLASGASAHPDLEHISNSHFGLPYLRKVRAAGSFANYERLHLDKLTNFLYS